MKPIKYSYLAMLLALLRPLITISQGTVAIGTGTSSGTSTPIAAYYNASASESIYLGSEIGITGNITKLAYYKASGTSTTAPNVKIYMKITTATNVGTANYAIGTANFSSYTLVYDGTLTNDTASGYMEVSLSSPFQFLDTSKNLSVVIIGTTCISSGRPQYRYTSTTTNKLSSTWTDGSIACGGSTSWDATKSFTPAWERPNIRFTLGAAATCTGTPAPGNTVSSSANVCAGSSFMLSLQNATAGAGIMYQWQLSSNGTTGWANITGATSSTLTTSQSQAAYYRCNVTCSGSTGTSTPLLVNIPAQAYASLPYNENFEAWQSKCDGESNVPSQYWNSTPSTGNNSWRRNDQGATAAWGSATLGTYSPSGQLDTYSARFHTYNVANGLQGSLDLYVDCSTGSSSKTLTFYSINTDGTDKLEVFVSTNGGASFTKIGSDITTATAWTLQTRVFTSSSAQTVVRITATSNFGTTDIGIDNLVVSDTPTCFPPTNIAAGSILANPATLSWTAATPAPGNGYEYYIATSSTIPATSAIATGTVSGTSVSLTGLTPDTTYYVWVRSLCSSSDKSAWSATYSFFTGYCSVSTTNTTDRISAFTTTGATQNVSYTAASQPAGSYSNQSAQTAIQQYAGSGFTFSTTYVGGANGVNIWVDWNNDLVFNDATEKVFTLGNSNLTKTGTIAIPTGTMPGNYRMRVRAQYSSTSNPAACGNVNYGSTIDFTLTVLPCYTWTGTTNNNWAIAGNWCGAVVPGATSDVTIAENGVPVISSGTANAGNLTINTGAILTIKEGATLIIHNTLVNNGQIIVENNAALVQAEGSAYSGNGTATVARDSNPLYRLDYTLWGAPVSGQNLLDFSPETSTNPSRFYTYGLIHDDMEEGYKTTDHTAGFIPGTGYLIRMPNSLPDAGYNAGTAAVAFEGVFTGKPNNGTVNVGISNLSGHYIAVANPYPSPISIQEFLAQNSDVVENTSAVYFWRKKNNTNQSVQPTSSYAYINATGFNINNPTSNIGGGGSNYYASSNQSGWIISPGQGFLVKLKAGLDPGTAKVKFTNSMRRAATLTNGNQPFFRTMENDNNTTAAGSRWWLNLSGANDAFSQALVGYLPQATLDIDPGYDAEMFNDAAVRLYSRQAEGIFGIQARPPFTESDVVPLGFSVASAGQYKLGIDHLDGVFALDQDIYLKDNLFGTVSNLKQADYIFTTEAGTFDTRFEVIYAEPLSTDLPLSENNGIIAYKQGNVINISSSAVAMRSVAVYDIRGRLLYNTENINTAEASITTLQPQEQMLIVKIVGIDGISTEKKIIF